MFHRFVKGDIITVLRMDDDWWEGKIQNGDGYVNDYFLVILVRGLGNDI